MPSICHSWLEYSRANACPGSRRRRGRGTTNPRRIKIACTVDVAGIATPSIASRARIFFAPHRPRRCLCNVTIASSTSAEVSAGLR